MVTPLSSIMLPLSSFEGVNLAQIKSVELLFGDTKSGSLVGSRGTVLLLPRGSNRTVPLLPCFLSDKNIHNCVSYNEQEVVRGGVLMSKRLYLSNDKMLGGVCGGIAEYFGIDPTLVRLISLVLIITTAFTGFLVYIGAWFIIPKKPMF